jgi:hypothetical protein
MTIGLATGNFYRLWSLSEIFRDKEFLRQLNNMAAQQHCCCSKEDQGKKTKHAAGN